MGIFYVGDVVEEQDQRHEDADAGGRDDGPTDTHAEAEIEVDQLRPAIAQDDAHALGNGEAHHGVDQLAWKVAASKGRISGEP